VRFRKPVRVDPEPSDTQAALVALFMMNAATGRGGHTLRDTYIVQESGEPVVASRVIRLLASLPKPTVCEAKQVGQHLAISWRKPDEADFIRFTTAQRLIHHGEGTVGTLARRQADARATPVLLVASNGDTAQVTVADLVAWAQSYVMAQPLTTGIVEPGQEPTEPIVVEAGPFEPIALESDSSRELMTWLSDSVNMAAVASDRGAIEGRLKGLARALNRRGHMPEMEGMRRRLAEAARIMRVVWAGREMPADVAAFVERFGRELR